MKDPHPTRKYPDQKVWVWVPFSSLIPQYGWYCFPFWRGPLHGTARAGHEILNSTGGPLTQAPPSESSEPMRMRTTLPKASSQVQPQDKAVRQWGDSQRRTGGEQKGGKPCKIPPRSTFLEAGGGFKEGPFPLISQRKGTF